MQCPQDNTSAQGHFFPQIGEMGNPTQPSGPTKIHQWTLQNKNTHGLCTLHGDAEEFDGTGAEVAGARVGQVPGDGVEQRPQQHAVLQPDVQVQPAQRPRLTCSREVGSQFSTSENKLLSVTRSRSIQKSQNKFAHCSHNL